MIADDPMRSKPQNTEPRSSRAASVILFLTESNRSDEWQVNDKDFKIHSLTYNRENAKMELLWVENLSVCDM